MRTPLETRDLGAPPPASGDDHYARDPVEAGLMSGPGPYEIPCSPDFDDVDDED
jgi:hypothetical protein